MYDIIDLMLQAMEHMGIEPEDVEDEVIVFTHDNWPCICVKCNPYTVTLSAYLYTPLSTCWLSDEFWMEVCMAAGDYVDDSGEYLSADATVLLLSMNFTPPYGEEPQVMARKSLTRFFEKTVPRAKGYVEGIPVLRDALGQHTQWGWTSPQKRIRELDCWIDVQPFTEGLAAVADSQGRYGFLDAEAKLVVPCRWAYAQSFSGF